MIAVPVVTNVDWVVGVPPEGAVLAGVGAVVDVVRALGRGGVGTAAKGKECENKTTKENK